jgi:putative membrane protein
MKSAYFLPVVLAAALVGGCNRKDHDQAAVPPAGSAPVGTSGEASADIPRADKDFVHDVAIANMAELDLARMAQDHAADANVKKFAQMMVTDHTKAGDELKQVAGRNHIEVPAQVDDDHRDKAEDLGKKHGADFDRAYADAMVDGHQAFVDKLESRIDKDTITRAHVDKKNAPDADVKASAVMPEKSDDPNTQAVNQIAADLYPSVYAHLQAAKALKDGVSKRSTN